MVTIRKNEKCRARTLEDRKYRSATILKVYKNKASVMFEDGSRPTIPLKYVWKLKQPTPKKHQSGKANDNKYVVIPRRLRSLVTIIPLCFGQGFLNGDNMNILKDEEQREISLVIYNENLRQLLEIFMNPQQPQPAGGGNAIARLYQHLCHSIGIPTGPFQSLNELYFVSLYGELESWHTAKDVIDASFARLVLLMVKHPKKQTIYYSAESPMCKDIGLAIFRSMVGDDVVDYITKKIYELPRLIKSARIQNYRMANSVH
jgi:hypothetical protein